MALSLRLLSARSLLEIRDSAHDDPFQYNWTEIKLCRPFLSFHFDVILFIIELGSSRAFAVRLCWLRSIGYWIALIEWSGTV